MGITTRIIIEICMRAAVLNYSGHFREPGEVGATHRGRRTRAVLLRGRRDDREAGRTRRRLLHYRRGPRRCAAAAHR